MTQTPASNANLKPKAGASFPAIAWPAVSGGEVAPAAETGWRLFAVYRGRHCPLCKSYFAKLNAVLDDFTAAGITVSVVSADTKEKAEADVAEHGWRFPVGYGLMPEQMRLLGLYVSEPRSPQETDRPFAEPALFVLNPAGETQIVDISNAPFARPDLAVLLNGLKFVMEKGYPIRGTLA